MFQRFFKRTRKIEIFSRHCTFSTISEHKARIPGFSHEKCYQNLLATTDFEMANLTCFLDIARGEKHFLPKDRRIEINAGTEAGSFLQIIDFAIAQKFHPETILYFVEDDYLHRPGWVNILLDGFSIEGVDYVTLYDHRDKYFSPMYQGLKSQLFEGSRTHFRETPSTTHTFACKYKTLVRDLEIHRKFSKNREISQDHEKFLELGKKGALLISSVPGYSTHAEPEFASPFFDWESLFKQKDST